MPFRPAVRSWEGSSEAEIDRKFTASAEDILAGRVLSQDAVDERMSARFRHG